MIGSLARFDDAMDRARALAGRQGFDEALAHAQAVDATMEHAAVFVSTSHDSDARVGSSKSTTTYRPEVRFRHLVSGQAYTSERLYPTSIVRTHASASEAGRTLAPFPLNAKVQAYVDPAHPERGFLIPETSRAPWVFIVIGLLLPPLAWWFGKTL